MNREMSICPEKYVSFPFFAYFYQILENYADTPRGEWANQISTNEFFMQKVQQAKINFWEQEIE